MTNDDLKHLAVKFCDSDAMTRDLTTEGALEYWLFLSRFLIYVEQRTLPGDVVQLDSGKEGKDGTRRQGS